MRDTEWISRQDPYVCLEYASSKFRTRTCTDGGKNPTFQEKFVFNLIEGLSEINVVVWNSNTNSYDDFIGSGKIQLQNVLLTVFDDSSWPIQTKNGRRGEQHMEQFAISSLSAKMRSERLNFADLYFGPDPLICSQQKGRVVPADSKRK
ncbi:hypothetical protein QQ045_000835 [Rhodiola kirilowii]